MGHFIFMTGALYRTYLFRVILRTAFWDVYHVNEASETTDILRFWRIARDLKSLES
jgi:hypothetical protein